MNVHEKTLLISADFGDARCNDVHVLLVSQYYNGQMIRVINEFYGEEADEMYKKLVGTKKIKLKEKKNEKF